MGGGEIAGLLWSFDSTCLFPGSILSEFLLSAQSLVVPKVSFRSVIGWGRLLDSLGV